MYSVKEIYYTLQGEGAQTGRAAVFCRFAGCNLWSGREADRASAICQFCDTDFADTKGPGGGKFASAEELAAAIEGKWLRNPERKATADPSTAPLAKSASGFAQDDTLRLIAQDDTRRLIAQDDKTEAGLKDCGGRRFVVCTGGEPLLQLDKPLIDALHARGFEIAVETNGSIAAPPGLDWICVSPKAGVELIQRTGHELKLVFPQPGPQSAVDPAAFESLRFRHFFLQPMDGPHRDANTQAALRYCLDHPRWRLSLQTHKLLGIP
jgi:7-carboxy-7-deazaguanine synthase (Cx14CxxC type)